MEPTFVLGLIQVSGARFFNSAVVVRKGVLVCRYRKMHLLDGEKAVFDEGESPSVFQVNGVGIGVSICYDLNFATSVSDNVAAGARLLACPCNNMMRRKMAEKLKDEHAATRRRRAMESGAWLLSSDVSGERDGRISYGPTSLMRGDGIVVHQVPLMEIGMIVGDVE